MRSSHEAVAAPGGDVRLRELLAGVSVLRILTLVWALAVSTIDARSGVLSHRLAAFVFLAVMGMWTAATAAWSWRTHSPLGSNGLVAIDVALACLVVAVDWFVYDQAHPLSFGSAWPLAAVVSTGVLRGWRAGLAAGVVVGLGGVVGPLLNDRLDGRVMAMTGTVVLFSVAGVVSGWLSARLARAESEVALARARDDVATTLHDGVLQTLAVIQRRSGDAELVRLARDQERELRTFLAEVSAPDRWRVVDPGEGSVEGVAAALRRAASGVEHRHQVQIDVIVIDDARLPADVVEALGGAAGEAMTNAAKHASADRITASVDAMDDGVVVAIVDDGVGFDPDGAPTGMGLAQSVRRMVDVGGRVVVRSKPGRGTEVELWVPSTK